ncbi:cell number regulator 2-like [Durio zibethinus]|uniref:Cell number regulator 2-like n=1 Tax=Durio zibethinus TaxID=66656 RepID=A0A6P6BH69_DURZI|nr:cell number regulator 2-like [Durio zibethinus]XP_022776445.1 cell number regulator 2-like [Durio zibethinus]
MANSKYSGESPWSSSLFDCFSDCSLCCQTTFCPCISFGRSAEIITKGSCSCGTYCLLYAVIHHLSGCLLSMLYGCHYRRKLRHEYGLESSPCPDLCVHCFCHYCALCQEYRELRNQGFNMKLGWNGNVERQNRGVTMAPVAEAGMKR